MARHHAWSAGGLTRLVLALMRLLGARAYRNKPNPHYDPGQPHHTPTGFQNLDPQARSMRDFRRWQRERRIKGPPPPPAPWLADWVDTPDLAWLAQNRSAATATWIGHVTVLVQMGGLNVLTDPVFSARASPLFFAGPRRYQPPAIGLRDLPAVDAVLISHNHYDHLDRASVQALHRRSQGATRFFVPLGLKSWFARLGIDHVTELDWWQSASWRGVDFHLVPAQHWSTRLVFDRNKTLWGGWVAGAQDLRFYFAGDTGYDGAIFAEIGRRFAPIDLAALPIGAYEPRWFMEPQHIDPWQAVQILRDVGARRGLPVHWGTFQLADEPLHQPLEDLARALQAAGLDESVFRAVRLGETLRL